MKECIPEESQLARYDRQMKKVLSHKTVMAHVMALACEEYDGLKLDEIIKVIPGEGNYARLLKTEYLLNGKIDYDLLIETKEKPKKYFDIEPQKNTITKRMLNGRSDVYLATKIVSQQGHDYQGEKYNQVVDVYSAWLLFQQKRGKVIRKSLHHMHKAYINIPFCYDPSEKNEHLRFLSLICDTSMEKNVKIRILEEEFGISEGLREEIKKMSIDNNVFVDYGRRIGRKQGIKQGIKQGRKQGIKQGIKQARKEQAIKTIDRMSADHFSVDLIAKYANVSKQFVYQYMQKKNKVKVSS